MRELGLFLEVDEDGVMSGVRGGSEVARFNCSLGKTKSRSCGALSHISRLSCLKNNINVGA